MMPREGGSGLMARSVRPFIRKKNQTKMGAGLLVAGLLLQRKARPVHMDKKGRRRGSVTNKTRGENARNLRSSHV